MRALLGLVLLGGLFLSAATWQGRTTERLREQRELEFGVPKDAESRRAGRAGWSELVLGRPSGQPALPPLAAPDSPANPVDPGSNSAKGSEAPNGEPRRYAPDFEYVVRPNDVLGVICQKHYGKGRLAKIIPAVASYNDLPTQDAIVAGRVLLLPDVKLLLGE